MVNALTWARQHDVALRVRSGRHSLEGWSNVDNGLVIDISELKSVHIDTGLRIARVGAGLNQLEAVTALARKNLAVTTGTEAAWAWPVRRSAAASAFSPAGSAWPATALWAPRSSFRRVTSAPR